MNTCDAQERAELEERFLEAVVHSPSHAAELIGMVKEGDFQDVDMRRAFRAVVLCAARGERVNTNTVHRELEKYGLYNRKHVGILLPGPEDREDTVATAKERAVAIRGGRAQDGSSLASQTALSWENDVVVLESFASVAARASEVRWLWPDWLPRGGVTVLASNPGEGKSALALEMVRRVVGGAATWPDGRAVSGSLCGTPAPGCVFPLVTTTAITHGGGCATQAGQTAQATQAVQQGEETAILIDSESGPSLLRRRMEDWHIESERLRVFTMKSHAAGLALPSLDRRDHWLAVSSAVCWTRPALVIFDSLSGVHAVSENSSRIRSLMQKFAALAQDSGAAVLVIHHLRKRSESSSVAASLDRLRGSSAIAQSARVVWAIDRPDPSDPRRRLIQIKNNLAATPPPIGFTIDSGGVSFGEAPKPVSQVAMAMELIQTVLAEGEVPTKEVFAQCHANGFPPTCAWRASHALRVVKKRESPKGPWIWSLPKCSKVEAQAQ